MNPDRFMILVFMSGWACGALFMGLFSCPARHSAVEALQQHANALSVRLAEIEATCGTDPLFDAAALESAR